MDVLVSQAQSVAHRCARLDHGSDLRPLGREWGGPKSDQVRRMKDLKPENQRPRRAMADLNLDELILAEAAGRNF